MDHLSIHHPPLAFVRSSPDYAPCELNGAMTDESQRLITYVMKGTGPSKIVSPVTCGSFSGRLLFIQPLIIPNCDSTSALALLCLNAIWFIQLLVEFSCRQIQSPLSEPVGLPKGVEGSHLKASFYAFGLPTQSNLQTWAVDRQSQSTTQLTTQP